MTNLYLDLVGENRRAFTQTTRLGTFVEEYAPGWAQINLGTLDAPNFVDMRVSPGVYAPGASVAVACGADGRPLYAMPPDTLENLPDDTPVVGVGDAGKRLLDTQSQVSSMHGELEVDRKRVDALETRFAQVDSELDSHQSLIDQILSLPPSSNIYLTEPSNPAVGDAWLGEDGLQVWDGTKWVQASKSEVALADLVTGDGDAPSPEVTSKLWDLMRAELVVSRGIITEDLIATNAITAAKIKASQELSAKVAEFITVNAEQVKVGADVQFTGKGMRIFHPLPEKPDGSAYTNEELEQLAGQRSVALDLTSEGSRFLSVANKAGEVTAYLTPDGEVHGKSGEITGEFKTDKLIVDGKTLKEHLDDHGFETVAFYILPTMTKPQGRVTADLATTDGVWLEPGLYRVRWPVALRVWRTSGVSGTDVSGAQIRVSRRTEGTDNWPEVSWKYDDRVIDWVTTQDRDSYFISCPEAWLEVRTAGEYRFYPNLRSTKSFKLDTEHASCLTVERAPAEKALGHTLVDFGSSGNTQVKPAPRTVTVGLSDRWYMYGSTFGVDGSRESGGNFRLPALKGKQIISIQLTGKCNWDFYDGGAGANFTFHVGGENRTVRLYDYGTVNLTYGSTAGAAIKHLGLAGFKLVKGPPYATFDPNSFRLTVTYQP